MANLLKFVPIPTSGPRQRGAIWSSGNAPLVRDIAEYEALPLIAAFNAHEKLLIALREIKRLSSTADSQHAYSTCSAIKDICDITLIAVGEQQ